MSVTFRDRYRMGLTVAPGIAGEFNIGQPTISFEKFSPADNGLTFDVVATDGGANWEIRQDCLYTYATNSLSRGTLWQSSNSDSPVDLSINTIIAVTLVSNRTFPSTITNAQTHDTVIFNGTDWVNAPAGSTPQLQLVRNDTSNTIYKGQAVYINGAVADKVTVALAQANAESTSSKTFGLAYQDIPKNTEGYVVYSGMIYDLDTTAAVNEGDPVWLSPTTAGGLIYGLANKPKAPNHLVYMGNVSRRQLIHGSIFIKVANGWELDELHDVQINGIAGGDMLQYDGSSNLWKNKAQNSLFIQDTAPTSLSSKYMWIQTGLGDGTDFTVWFENGI